MEKSIWNPELTPLTLIQKTHETPDAVSFYFCPPSSERFMFKPGQFITIKAHIEGKIYGRAYSISSLPEDDLLQLTIKRVKDGIVSNWMIDHLRTGEHLWAYGFGGDFNISDLKPKDQVVFISAGCGITPVMGMARYLLQTQEQSVKRIDFIHRARGLENIIYYDALTKLAQQYTHFLEHLVLGDHITSNFSKRIYRGTITREFLEKACPEFADASIYLCGPWGFMQSIEALLGEVGFDMANLHHEKFLSPCYQVCQSEEKMHKEEHRLTVSVPDLNVVQDAVPGELLLNVLEKAKVPLIAACRSGVCGSCKCKVTKGKVETSSLATITQQEKENNYVLACSSKLIEDVEITIL